MRCEMCDREPRRVFRAAGELTLAGYFTALPRGDGRGHIVPYWPQPPWSIAASFEPCADPMYKAHAIFTCGDEICRWRARTHGAPGVVYGAAA